MDIPDLPISEHLPIDLFCDLIDRFPKKPKKEAITIIALAIGAAPDPTGLKPTGERLIKHLYWDLTPADLHARMCRLVDEFNIAEEMLVRGTIAFLESHLARLASHEATQKRKDIYENMLQKVSAELGRPVEQRDMQVSDEELRDLRGKLQIVLVGLQDRRQAIKDALKFFQKHKTPIFTERMWEAFNWWRAGKNLPRHLRDLLPPEDDEDT